MALWLTVPDDCRMVGEFEIGNDGSDIAFLFGSNRDDAHLLFEREALVRFVELAQRMLAVPSLDDTRTPPPITVVASPGYGFREESRDTCCGKSLEVRNGAR